jgi:hypothetical protein
MHSAAFGFGSNPTGLLSTPLVGCAVQSIQTGASFFELAAALPSRDRANGRHLIGDPRFHAFACGVMRAGFAFDGWRWNEPTVHHAVQAAGIGTRYMLRGGHAAEGTSWLTRAAGIAETARAYSPGLSLDDWPGITFPSRLAHRFITGAVVRLHPDEVSGALMIFGRGDRRGLARYDAALRSTSAMIVAEDVPSMQDPSLFFGVRVNFTESGFRYCAAALAKARTLIRKADALIDLALANPDESHLEEAARLYSEAYTLMDNMRANLWEWYEAARRVFAVSGELLPDDAAIETAYNDAIYYRDIAQRRYWQVAGTDG